MRVVHQIIILGVLALAVPLVALAGSTNSPPLPTVEEILTRVVERSKQERQSDRDFDARFIYVRTRLTETRNGDGEIKKREEKITTNTPALKKLPAPPAMGAGAASEKGSPAADNRAKPKKRAYEKDDFDVNEDLLKRFSFTLLGRETVNGRPTLIVDFEPAKDKFPERNIRDRFLNRTAGRVWLDEEDMTMAKAAIRLTDRVNVIGGLVGAVWKMNFGFERLRTDDGLWYTRDATWHLEGRELFSQRIMDYHETRTGVRCAQ